MTKALTTFGPEILAALIEGSRREVVIDLPYNDAVVLRMRMHQLRAAMRKEKHKLSHVVDAAKLTIRWGEEVKTSISKKGVHYPSSPYSIVQLVLRPQDSTYRKALEKAGISLVIPDIEPALACDITGGASPEGVIEEFLGKRPRK